MQGTSRPVIAVGVDGSASSRAALEFAIREGVARGSAVEVVTVWSWSGPHEPLGGPATPQEARERAQRAQDEAVAGVLRATSATPVSPVISRQVVQGDAGQVLLRAGRHADYLVVGSAHKGRLRRAVLGSVSEYCVRHATCPVVVIPTVRRQAAETALAVAR